MGAACCSSQNTNTIAPAVKYEPLKSPSGVAQQKNSGIPSFTKIGVSTSDPLRLIYGYENEPLVSLEEALKPFDGTIDQLSQHIKEAKTKCYYPSKHNLTRDESAAIYIYTMRWGEGCLYDQLQIAWESKDRAKLKPWFMYFKLFRAALDKLPNAKAEVWQGTSFDEKLKEQLSSNTSVFYSSMGSCLQSVTDVKEYLKTQNVEKTILVGYESIEGKVVAGYTANNFNEVMLWPGMKIGVTNYWMMDDATLIVHLKRKSEGLSKPDSQKSFSCDKHFVCRYKGCGNRCPGDHKGDHCYKFAILLHICSHHCGPCNKCEKCDKVAPNLCKCYNCGSTYCPDCCYK